MLALISVMTLNCRIHSCNDDDDDDDDDDDIFKFKFKLHGVLTNKWLCHQLYILYK